MSRIFLLALALTGAALLSSGTSALAATTIVINSAADPGDGACNPAECTLREAIDEANDQPDANVIEFNIPGAPPHSIKPLSELPPVGLMITVDGSSQPGYAGTPVIEIDGSLSSGGDGLHALGPEAVIRALAINRFQAVGVVMGLNDEIRIEDNFIGTDTQGQIAAGNGTGIAVGSEDSTIIGNLISGNLQTGLHIGGGSAGTTVLGNRIGTDVTGMLAIPNEGNAGVDILFATGITVGGASPPDRNIISGNESVGIVTGSGNTIRGNYIGVGATGASALGNGGRGVVVDGPNNLIQDNVVSANDGGIDVFSAGTGNRLIGNLVGTTADGAAPLGNGFGTGIFTLFSTVTIGGSGPGEGNIISGHDAEGLWVAGGGGNVVFGNKIGTDISGAYAIPNTQSGIRLAGASNTLIGGSAPGEGNTIAGNLKAGIILTNAPTGTRIRGNNIGTNSAGTAALPNEGDGIEFPPGPSPTGTWIGGILPDEGNLISGNYLSGIVFHSGEGTQVLGNKIGTKGDGTPTIPNGMDGISIVHTDDITVGQPGAGANTIVGNDGSGVLVIGNATGNTIRGNSIHSNVQSGINLTSGGNMEIPSPQQSPDPFVGTVCAGCTVDIYSDDDGQGRIHEGSTTADGAGNWSFAGPATGPNITATATDAGGNTSEFSAPQPCQACGPVGGTVELTAVASESSRSPSLIAALAGLAAITLSAAVILQRRLRG